MGEELELELQFILPFACHPFACGGEWLDEEVRELGCNVMP